MSAHPFLKSLAVVASAALLAAALGAPVMAKPDKCTFDFERDLPGYNPNGFNDYPYPSVEEGDVVCGGCGHDRISVVNGGKVVERYHAGCPTTGGVYYGLQVATMNGGTFTAVRLPSEKMSSGASQVEALWGGTVNTNKMRIDIVDMHGGTVNNRGRQLNLVQRLHGGTFNGGAGDDMVFYQYGGTFNGGGGTDTVVSSYVAGECKSVVDCPR